MRRDCWTGLAVLLSLAPAVWGDAADSLAEHRRLWRDAALDGYEYGYHKFCECTPETPPETLVTVIDGEVVNVRHRPHGFDRVIQADPREIEWYWTVEQLFDLVDSALERGDRVSVEYDETLGFPTRLYIDRDADAIGDELDLQLTRLEPVGD